MNRSTVKAAELELLEELLIELDEELEELAGHCTDVVTVCDVLLELLGSVVEALTVATLLRDPVVQF